MGCVRMVRMMSVRIVRMMVMGLVRMMGDGRVMMKPDPGGDSPLSRACKVIAELRKTRPAYLALEIIREGDPQRQPVFFRHLVEDHASFPGGQYSYQEFMAHVSRHA